ncbi:endospore germination permease [Thermicanus aegyptius]|uniref:endospore germination permease n=1 Tax=Thermicanus aegyptius TaxID=94009 RepID=UPI0003F64218|nr:endospore germination permease [Thermicanus aegyptius]
MKDDYSSINTLHAGLLMLTSAGLYNHVMVIPHLLASSGRDAWFSSLLAAFPLLLLLFLLSYLMKRMEGTPLYVWVRERGGRIMAGGLSFLFALYLFLQIYITIKEMIHWTIFTYLTEVPNWVLNLFFLLAVGAALYGGLTTITITNIILLPVIILLGFFVATGNVPNKDYSLLFPLLENGVTPLLRGILYTMSGFSEIALLLLLLPYVKKRIHFTGLFLLSLSFIWLLLGPLTGAIAIFGPKEGSMLRFPAYEEWSIVSIGTILTHVDYLAINQWLSGALIRVSLLSYLLLSLFPAADKSIWRKRGLLFFLILFFLSSIPIPDTTFFVWQKRSLLFTFYLLLLLLFFLFILAVKGKKRA